MPKRCWNLLTRIPDPLMCPSFGIPGMTTPCTGCRGHTACILKYNESDSPIGMLTVPQPVKIEAQRTEVDHEHAQSKYGSRIVNGPGFRKLSRTLSKCGLSTTNNTHWKIRGVAAELLIIVMLDADHTRLRFPTIPKGFVGATIEHAPGELGMGLRVPTSAEGRTIIRKTVNQCLPHHLNTQRPQSSS